MNTLQHARRSSTRVAALAAVSWALLAGGAFAAPDQEVRSVKVSYADLNLSSLAGATALYHRIEKAAFAVCGPERSPRDLSGYHVWKNCYQGAIANAVAQVNSPMLTEVHSSKTRAPKGVELLSQRSSSK